MMPGDAFEEPTRPVKIYHSFFDYDEGFLTKDTNAKEIAYGEHSWNDQKAASQPTAWFIAESGDSPYH
jgi:beta-lactamase class D